jgi:lysophospholipase L1-like esterase
MRVEARLVVPALLLALSLACSNDSSGPVGPTPPPGPNDPVFYTALGASDAAGAGSTVPCVPFTECPNGTGYVQVITRRMQTTRSVTLVNLGIPGAVLSPEIERLGDELGRDIFANFLEREAPFVPRNTNLVTVFAGANDANTIAAGVAAGRAGGNVRGFVDGWAQTFARDYALVLERIRDRAPGTRIVVANVPNLAGLPYVSSRPLAERQVMQLISVKLTTEAINPLVSRGVVVVDTMCDGRSYNPGVYSSDGFHPNDAGYTYWADVLLAAINAAAGPTPPASCAQMTLVPPI